MRLVYERVTFNARAHKQKQVVFHLSSCVYMRMVYSIHVFYALAAYMSTLGQVSCLFNAHVYTCSSNWFSHLGESMAATFCFLVV
jgi:hypothetical protein